MITTTTHDTKRGEDVRARLAVLSEMPEAWGEWTREWLAIAERHGATVDDEPAPSAADRYLFLQTVVGTWPMTGGVSAAWVERLVAYAVKAAREAKQRTSWLASNDAYEEALRAFVRGMMSDPEFTSSAEAKVGSILTHGASNGLGLVALKIASPGVADTYQGSELWDLRLVDRDNRDVVDYESRVVLLRSLADTRPSDVGELLRSWPDGRIKLWVLRQGLRLRRELPRVVIEGDYAPIDAGDDVFAFSRTHATGALVCAVVRAPMRVTRGKAPWAIADVWGARTITLPEGRWRDVLTDREHDGGEVRAARLFGDLPLSLLVRRRW
jgi:(1->4)-alpha-D-glucan 1-alpha-D-glucosylmutase